MPSVRDRIVEREQPQAEPSRSTRTSSTAGHAPNSSVRARAQAARIQAEPEERLRPPKDSRPAALPDAGAMKPAHTPGIRERIEREQHIAREKAIPVAGETVSDSVKRASDYYYNEFLKEQAAKKAAEAEAEQAQRQRLEDERKTREYNAWMLPIRMAFDQWNATGEERRRVMDVITKRFPGCTADKATSVLFVLREATGFKPEWARQ